MRGRTSVARAVAALALAGLALGVSGCGGSGQPEASAAPTTVDELCAGDLVIACSAGETSLRVELGASVTDDAALAFALDARAVGESEGLTGGVTVEVEGPEAPQLDVEISEPPKWTVEVYPGDAEEVRRTLEQVIEVSDVPGTTGISLDTSGWPTVMVLNLSEFEWVFTSVEQLPLFAGGGTYTLVSNEPRLRVVHVPDRMSEDAVREVIAIGLEYVDAEVLLEAATTAPHNPALYISGLTEDEAEALDARLSDPELADADVDGYPVSYVLGWLSADGMQYLSGTFGDVGAD